MLVVFAGLPGVGKSTLAKILADRLGAFYIRIDSIERAIAASSMGTLSVEDAGYRVGYALAEDNLRLDRPVVADSVNPLAVTRAAWRAVAMRCDCEVVEVVVICSDQTEHRRRVEQRAADHLAEGWPGWQAVLDREYEEWTDAGIVIDTARMSVEEAVAAIFERLDRQSCLAKPARVL